jgi:hypothetical protein
MSDRVSDNHGGEGSKRGRGRPRKTPPSEKTVKKREKIVCLHGNKEPRKCMRCFIAYRKHCTENGIPVNESLFQFCSHLKQRSRCVECNGVGICSHGGLRYMCKVCGGSSICSHGRQKSKCKPCKGSAICCHDKEKNKCKVCDGRALCSHGIPKTRCVPCKGGSICQHQRLRNLCIDCGGKGLCVHGRIRWKCVECVDRSKLCPCGKVSSQCTKCKKMRQMAKEVSARPEVSTSDEQAQATLAQSPEASMSGEKAQANLAQSPESSMSGEQAQATLPPSPEASMSGEQAQCAAQTSKWERSVCPHGKSAPRHCKPCFREYEEFCVINKIIPRGSLFDFCPHLKQKSRCAECKGVAVCPHGKPRYVCIKCVDPSKICPCGKVSGQCNKCRKMRQMAKGACASSEASTSGEQAQSTLVDDGRPNPTIYCFQCTQHLEVDNFPPGPAYLDLTICKSCELESHQDEMNP